MGITVILLFIALLVSFFYHQEKKKRLLSERKLQAEQAEEEARRLQHENELLHKEAELSALREKEIFMRNKESEMREALFRHISFFQKLPSLHTENSPEDGPNSRKITVNDAEWSEVKQAVMMHLIISLTGCKKIIRNSVRKIFVLLPGKDQCEHTRPIGYLLCQ